MMLFGRKYSHELNQTFLKENWGDEKKNNKQILLLATITNTLLSVLMQGDYMKV